MSSDGDEASTQTSEPPTAGKDQMISLLIRTGRIRPNVAASLYDQGLNDPSKVRSLERADFLKYKGVGEKTADALMELRTLPDEVPPVKEMGLWETLKKGKIRANVIESLREAGLDTPEKIKGAGREGLMALKGIGGPTADQVIEIAKTVPEEPAKPSIEDASAVQAPEEALAPSTEPAKGKGVMEKLSSFFKGLFGKKTEPEKSPQPAPAESQPDLTAAETPSATPEATPPSATETTSKTETDTSTEQAPPKVEEIAPEVQPTYEVKDEKPIEDKASAQPDLPIQVGSETETPPTEQKIAGEAKEEQAPAVPPAAIVAPEQPKQGFFDKIFSMFKKTPTPSPPQQQTAEPEIPKGPEKGPETSDTMITQAETTPRPVAPEPEVVEKMSEINSIDEIPGIGPELIQRLKDASYNSVDELREAIPEDLTMVQGIDIETARKICEAIKKP